MPFTFGINSKPGCFRSKLSSLTVVVSLTNVDSTQSRMASCVAGGGAHCNRLSRNCLMSHCESNTSGAVWLIRSMIELTNSEVFECVDAEEEEEEEEEEDDEEEEREEDEEEEDEEEEEEQDVEDAVEEEEEEEEEEKEEEEGE